jgi:hypothetical protein
VDFPPPTKSTPAASLFTIRRCDRVGRSLVLNAATPPVSASSRHKSPACITNDASVCLRPPLLLLPPFLIALALSFSDRERAADRKRTKDQPASDSPTLDPSLHFPPSHQTSPSSYVGKEATRRFVKQNRLGDVVRVLPLSTARLVLLQCTASSLLPHLPALSPQPCHSTYITKDYFSKNTLSARSVAHVMSSGRMVNLEHCLRRQKPLAIVTLAALDVHVRTSVNRRYCPWPHRC